MILKVLQMLRNALLVGVFENLDTLNRGDFFNWFFNLMLFKGKVLT